MKHQDTIKFKKGIIQADLLGLNFEDDGVFYVYSPTLDLIASGETQEEAFENFKVVAELYFEFVVSEGTLEKELRKLGWTKHKRIKSRFKPPVFTPEHVMTLKGYPNFEVNNQPLAVYA